MGISSSQGLKKPPKISPREEKVALQEARFSFPRAKFKVYFNPRDEEISVPETRVSKGRDVPGQTGTGRPVVPLSRDKKVSLSRRPFVPGQKSFACPAVPLSRDKGRSKCPGTNSSVPGRPGTK